MSSKGGRKKRGGREGNGEWVSAFDASASGRLCRLHARALERRQVEVGLIDPAQHELSKQVARAPGAVNFLSWVSLLEGMRR